MIHALRALAKNRFAAIATPPPAGAINPTIATMRRSLAAMLQQHAARPGA